MAMDYYSNTSPNKSHIKSHKFKRRIEDVEAVQFIYTPECILAVQNLCGDSAYDFTKDRHIKAVGYCTVATGIEHAGATELYDGRICKEFDYIVKYADGSFNVMSPIHFVQTYVLAE